MSRKVFFSFHYRRDSWRVGQVRNSNLIPNEDEYGYVDSAEWETIERAGDEAIKRWINDQIKYTSVTVVLIGAETAQRSWVKYEIQKSWERGNAIVGIRIHNIKDQEQKTDFQGANPFDGFTFEDGAPLSSVCKVYDWVLNDGRKNMGAWVEQAFQERQNLKDKGGVKEKAVASRPTTPPAETSSSFSPRAPWSN